MTYNSANNKIYVGGEKGNCVIVIDGVTNEKIAKIPVGYYTSALCYNLTNNKVYCANRLSDNVTVIDGANNSVITTIPVGERPIDICWNRIRNRVYVANSYGSSILVFRDVMIGIEDARGQTEEARIFEASPNQFRTQTTLRYSIFAEGNVSLLLYDISGRLVKTLVNQVQTSRNYSVNWNGNDDNGRKVGQGVYFCVLKADGQGMEKNLLMLR